MERGPAKRGRTIVRIGAAAAVGAGVLVGGQAAFAAAFYRPGLPVGVPHAPQLFANNALHHLERSSIRPTSHLAPRVSTTIENAAPTPNFLVNCAPTGFDNTGACSTEALAAVDSARASEGLGPLPFSLGAFLRLVPADQLFVLTDLERTSRGLPPFVALLPDANQIAAEAAAANTDPTLPGSSPVLGGGPVVRWGANWAGGTANALGANYYWMYDDGPGGANIACTPTDHSGCYGHRDNILTSFSTGACGSAGTPTLVMGAATTSTGTQGIVSLAEIEAEACSPSLAGATFTWAQAQQLLGIPG